jgi:hypothetical protein
VNLEQIFRNQEQRDGLFICSIAYYTYTKAVYRFPGIHVDFGGMNVVYPLWLSGLPYI